MVEHMSQTEHGMEQGSIKASWIDLSDDFDVNCIVDENDSANITMPENQTVCLKDGTGALPVYMLDGEISANGRFTSVGDTILVQEHDGASFEGIGSTKGQERSMEQVGLLGLEHSQERWSIRGHSIKQVWFLASMKPMRA